MNRYIDKLFEYGNGLSYTLKSIPLKFIKPATTSRGTLLTKPSWLLELNNKGKKGIGECSLIPGLSPENEELIPQQFVRAFKFMNSDRIKFWQLILDNPAICFALETAAQMLEKGEEHIYFKTDFTDGKVGIPINGLVWMSDTEEMYLQAKAKIESGFKCIKFKISKEHFLAEIEVLQRLRNEFGFDFEMRLDANGSFDKETVFEALQKLEPLQIHSIEQPVMPSQVLLMKKVCAENIIDIALDEQLIGFKGGLSAKINVIEYIKPKYLILKPSLMGGLFNCEEWVDACEITGIDWWATSALESNIGLNAIAQWTANLHTKRPQGLGTGALFENNFHTPCVLQHDTLWFKA